METIKASELIGKRVTLRVHEEPCHVVMPGCIPLVGTVVGTIEKFDQWPGGPVGYLRDDAGHLIAFDAGFDLKNGKIEIEV